jgi:hypothetical protein
VQYFRPISRNLVDQYGFKLGGYYIGEGGEGVKLL